MTSKVVALSERMSILLPFAYVLDMMNALILTYYAFCENFVNALFRINALIFYCRINALILTYYAFSENFVNALFPRERVRIRSLVGEANLVGTIICVGGAMLVTLCKEITINLWSCKDNASSDDDQSVSGILMKGSLLLGGTFLGFILQRLRRPQLRNSRRAYAFIMFLLLFIMNAVASTAAVNTTDGVPEGDELPPGCHYVAQCGLCLRCYRGWRGFHCCD